MENKNVIVFLGILLVALGVTLPVSAQSIRLGQYIANDDKSIYRFNADGSSLGYNADNPNTILARGTYSIRGDRITLTYRSTTNASQNATFIFIITNDETMTLVNDPRQTLRYIRPVVVVSDFELQSRDISADEANIVKNMFMDALALNRAVSVVEQNILTNKLTELNFENNDWTNKTKTAQLGTALNANYLVRGTITQLGTSITFTVVLRDIKTLDIITTVQKLYTSENVWDNSNGIPGTLTGLANETIGIGGGYTAAVQVRRYQVIITTGENTPIGMQRFRQPLTVEALSPSEAESEARKEWSSIYGRTGRHSIISVDEVKQLD